jgi:hypothetical protein
MHKYNVHSKNVSLGTLINIFLECMESKYECFTAVFSPELQNCFLVGVGGGGGGVGGGGGGPKQKR